MPSKALSFCRSTVANHASSYPPVQQQAVVVSVSFHERLASSSYMPLSLK